MDSLTQLVLGAAVGDVVAGRKAGNKALWWGAVGGTIPDLDVFLNLFYDEPRSLLLHRGFSHSVFFAFLAAPLLGYLLSKADRTLNRREWTLVFFWSIFTHPLLDIFTGYGTGLFVPVWDYRIQFDTIFIIDPLFTVPLLITFVWLLVQKIPAQKRMRLSANALKVSCSYLLVTVLVKLWVVAKVNESIERQAISTERKMIAPAAFTTFLWSVIVQEGDHFLVGYYSLFDQHDIRFSTIPAHHELVKQIDQYEETQMLIKFTKGYFAVEQEADSFIWNDLRFGTAQGWDQPGAEYIFAFRLIPRSEELEVERVSPERRISGDDLSRVLKRTFGQ